MLSQQENRVLKRSARSRPENRRLITSLVWLLAAALLAIMTAVAGARDRPSNRIYATHQGWEYRTEHFITFATTSPDDARWAGEALEEGWEATARLADHFGVAHRRLKMNLAGALVFSAAQFPRAGEPRTERWRLSQVGPQTATRVVQVTLASGPDARAAAKRRLRQQSAATLLRESGYSNWLPQWAAEGLVAYVAEEKWADERYAAALTDLRRMGQSSLSPELAFRYLMVADDARWSADFLATLGEQAPPPTTHRVPIHGVYQRVGPGIVPPPRQDRLPTGLPNFGDAPWRERMEKWLADPHDGKLTVDIDSSIPERDARRAREMALIVKLGHRAQTSASHEHTTELGNAAAAKADALTLHPVDLHRRLASNPQRWSTLDVDGRVLTWRDRRRIDELLIDAAPAYRTVQREECAVLQSSQADGSMFEAWLEKGKGAEASPVVRVRRVEKRANF